MAPDGWVYHVAWWVPRIPLVLPPEAGLVGSAVTMPGNFLLEASGDGGATWLRNSVPALEGVVLTVRRGWPPTAPGRCG